MRRLLLASCLAVGLGVLAVGASGPAQATDNDDVSSGGGCGFSIFCGWWYWTIQGSGGGVGGAGTCYAGDNGCIPVGATNPGQPGDPCFNNPYTDGCGGGSTSWTQPSQSGGGAGGAGGAGGGRNRRR